MLFEIKSWFKSRVLFSLDCGSLRLCVEAAIKSGADLTYADLTYADLTSANLTYANLRSANLTYANLRYADLTYANLRSANLRYADLRSANLRYANLRYANLRSANLRYADLRSADLRYANLRYAKWPKDAAVLRHPIQLWGLRWPVTIFGSHMQIGCEVHAVREWEAFEDRRILEMSGREALDFWHVNKMRLLAFRDVEAEEAFAAKERQNADAPASTATA